MYAIDGDRRIFFDVEGTHTGWRDGQLVERPVILTVHGGPGFPHVYFRPWLSALADRYCVVYVDLRGAGLSSRHPGSGYPFEEFVDDVELVRRTLGLERVTVLGHSFGGPVVMEYALKHPDAVSALVLACTIHSFGAMELSTERQAKQFERVDPDLLEDVTALTETLTRALGGDSGAWAELDDSPTWGRITRTQFATQPPELWDMASANMRIGAEVYYLNTGLAAAMPDQSQLGQWDIRPRLPEISAPTLVIGAESEAEYAAPVDVHGREIADLIPDATLEVVPDVGHYFFAEDTAAFTDPIAAFLEGAGLPGADPDAALLGRAPVTP